MVAVASGWGLLVGTRMGYPVLLPYIREIYGLSLSVAGHLVTILWLGSALGQLLGAVGPVSFGLMAERGFFDAGNLALAGLMATIVLLLIQLPRS